MHAIWCSVLVMVAASCADVASVDTSDSWSDDTEFVRALARDWGFFELARSALTDPALALEIDTHEALSLDDGPECEAAIRRCLASFETQLAAARGIPRLDAARLCSAAAERLGHLLTEHRRRKLGEPPDPSDAARHLQIGLRSVDAALAVRADARLRLRKGVIYSLWAQLCTADRERMIDRAIAIFEDIALHCEESDTRFATTALRHGLTLSRSR